MWIIFTASKTLSMGTTTKYGSVFILCCIMLNFPMQYITTINVCYRLIAFTTFCIYGTLFIDQLNKVFGRINLWWHEYVSRLLIRWTLKTWRSYNTNVKGSLLVKPFVLTYTNVFHMCLGMKYHAFVMISSGTRAGVIYLLSRWRIRTPIFQVHTLNNCTHWKRSSSFIKFMSLIWS